MLVVLASDYVAGIRADAWIRCDGIPHLIMGDHVPSPVPGCRVLIAVGNETHLRVSSYIDERGEFSGISTRTGLECLSIITHARLPDAWIHIGHKITYTTPSGQQMHAYNHGNRWYHTSAYRNDQPYESADVWFQTRVHLQQGSIVSPSIYSHRHQPPCTISPITLILFGCSLL